MRGQNVIQQWVEKKRDEFLGYVDEASKNKRRVWVFCGDGCEGNRKGHGLVTPDRGLQQKAYLAVIRGMLRDGDVPYVVRGTEWHTGPLAQDEERVASDLFPDFKTPVEPVTQAFSRYQLRLSVNGTLIDATHHIGTTRSPISEATALTTHLVKTARNAGRWGERLPDILARAHRHQFCMVHVPGRRQGQCIFTLPAWVAKGEYAMRVEPNDPAQVGGVVVTVSSAGYWQIHPHVWAVPGPDVEETT